MQVIAWVRARPRATRLTSAHPLAPLLQFKEGEAREQEEKEQGQAAPPAPAKQAPAAEQAPPPEQGPSTEQPAPAEKAPTAEQAGPASSVTFAVKHHVEWTQKVKVVGSPEVLGAWDCAAAPGAVGGGAGRGCGSW